MKNIVLILLLTIYSLSTFGVSLKEFYCCGKLKSVSVAIADDAKDKCSKGDSKDGCCKTKYQYFKVKDNHLATGDVTMPVKPFTNLLALNPSYQNYSLIPQLVEIANGSHAPPLYAGIPVYISNCVFRI